MDKQYKYDSYKRFKPKKAVIDRKCLGCGKMFWSEPGLHVCKTCKNQKSWQDGDYGI